MTIYDIDSKIQQLLDGGVDEATGELLFDPEALEALQMERDTKIENLALAVKNMGAEARAIKAEEEALAKRRKAVEAKEARACKYLNTVLAGDKFKSPRVAVTYRKSTKLELDPFFVAWAIEEAPQYLRQKEPEADKTAITAALKAGENVPGAVLVESQSMQIK